MPLPEILQMVMRQGAESMRRPIEIELAGNIDRDGSGEIYLLQIRPIVDSKQRLDVDITTLPDSQCLMRTASSLGHGIIDDVSDVVYVKTGDGFSAQDNPAIADEVERMNRRFLDSGEGYVLAGPGRWGSSDPWLGVPVKWPHISGARLICEVAVPGYFVEPSQGTHFFQNLTSLGVGYFTVDKEKGFFRQDKLDSMPAVEETVHLRHVRFDRPLRILMDGMKQVGAVLTGDAAEQEQ